MAWLLFDPILSECLQGRCPYMPQLSPAAGKVQSHVVQSEIGSSAEETSPETSLHANNNYNRNETELKLRQTLYMKCFLSFFLFFCCLRKILVCK